MCTFNVLAEQYGLATGSNVSRIDSSHESPCPQNSTLLARVLTHMACVRYIYPFVSSSWGGIIDFVNSLYSRWLVGFTGPSLFSRRIFFQKSDTISRSIIHYNPYRPYGRTVHRCILHSVNNTSLDSPASVELSLVCVYIYNIILSPILYFLRRLTVIVLKTS